MFRLVSTLITTATSATALVAILSGTTTIADGCFDPGGQPIGRDACNGDEVAISPRCNALPNGCRRDQNQIALLTDLEHPRSDSEPTPYYGPGYGDLDTVPSLVTLSEVSNKKRGSGRIEKGNGRTDNVSPWCAKQPNGCSTSASA